MENLVFRAGPNERNECDQRTLVDDPDDQQQYVVQERIAFDALRSGKPYLRVVRRMTVDEFLATDQPQEVKLKLQSILGGRQAAKT